LTAHDAADEDVEDDRADLRGAVRRADADEYAR
jgi:hypothetical protein